jgi:hypothetical protein
MPTPLTEILRACHVPTSRCNSSSGQNIGPGSTRGRCYHSRSVLRACAQSALKFTPHEEVAQARCMCLHCLYIIRTAWIKYLVEWVDKTTQSKRSIMRWWLSGSSTPGTAGHWLWPKIMNMNGSLQWQMAGESYTLYRIWLHHSKLKMTGHQPKKNYSQEQSMFLLFHPTMGLGKQDFATCLAVPPTLLTGGKARAFGQMRLGASSKG